MSLELNKKYYIAEGVERLQEEDKVLYINYETATWFRINTDGAEIIEKCDGSMSLKDILQSKADKDGFSLEVISRLLLPFLEISFEKGMLIEKKEFEIPELSDELTIDYPSNIWIHVSDKCNLACPFCYSNSSSGGNQYVDTEQVLLFLAQVPIEKREGIVISGGEPFLYPDLVKLLQGIKDLGYYNVNVITNGTVGSEKYAEVIPCISSLQISLDGSKAEIHDITRGKGSFEKICQNIELAHKYDVGKLYCSVTPTKYNVEDIPNIPWFAYHHHVDALHVTRLMPTGRGRKNKDSLYPDVEFYNQSLRKFVENVSNVNQYIYLQNSSKEIFDSDNKKQDYLQLTMASDQSPKVIEGRRRLSCGLGTLVSIGYDSKIYPCPSLAFPEFVMGDLNDSMDVIMKRINSFANQYSVNNCNEDCKTCKIKYFCGGGCRACTYGLGDIQMKDPSCEYYKESIMNILWNYVPQNL